MPYKLGAIGVGHWVKRLQRTLAHDGRIVLHKAVGVTSFEQKRADLEEFGITKDNYFQIEPLSQLPKEFFNGIDAVQIASHNKFHAKQTMQSLENEKVTVVEKTFAVNRESFEQVIDYIKSNNHTKRVTVHLHYLGKMLTLELPKILPDAIKEFGKIKNVVGTFFEDENLEDARRNWLYKPENGGIFLDWIHPIEILYKGCGATFGECHGAETFIIKPEYDPIYPTAISAKFKLSGSNFTSGATATIRVGKGFPHGILRKTLRLYFENGGFLDLNYVSSEQEFTSDLRGTWKLGKLIDGKIDVVRWGAPKGPISYEFLVDDMVKMIEGGKPRLSIEDIQKIYEPLWEFQDISSKLEPKKSNDDIQNFIKTGLEKSTA